MGKTKKDSKTVIHLNYWTTEGTVKTENSEKWIILILWPQSKDTKDRQEEMKGARRKQQPGREMEGSEETENGGKTILKGTRGW